MQKTGLLEALGVTYAAIGQEVSDAALEIIASDLTQYPQPDVMEALTRCRRELRKITLADILDRLPNGHPGAEEAWAMVKHAIGDERTTLVLTLPMHAAFLAADALDGDEIAARMTFKEVYQREVGRARAGGAEIEWTAVLGHNPAQRDETITQALREGKLMPEHAAVLLSYKAGPLSLEELTALAPAHVQQRLEQLNVKRLQ